MELRLFEFCEFATVGNRNNLTIAGIFDSVQAAIVGIPPGAQMPNLAQVSAIVLPKCYLVFTLSCSLIEGTRHEGTLQFHDEDGKAFASDVNVPLEFIVNADGRPMRFQGIATLGSLPLPGCGDYVVRLLVDGAVLGSASLYVSEAPRGPAAA